MHKFTNTLTQTEPFLQLTDLITENKSIIEIAGLTGSLPEYIASILLEHTGRSVLFVTPSPLAAEMALDDITAIAGADSTGFLPPAHLYPFETVPIGTGPRNERVEALMRLSNGQPTIFVTQPESLLERGPDRKWIDEHTMRISIGNMVERDTLLAYLVEAGYQRENVVDDQGQFAIRGGLIDIFPYGYEKPVRIEFDGDEIISLRRYDPTTQRSIDKLEEILLILDDHTGNSTSGDLLNLIPSETIIVWNDLDSIEKRIDKFREQAETAFDKGQSVDALPPALAYLTKEEIFSRSANFQQVIWQGPLKRSKYDIHFHSVQPDPAAPGLENLHSYLIKYTKRNSTIWICTDSSGEQQRLDELLNDNEVDTVFTLASSVSHGFVMEKSGIALITSHELFGRKQHRARHTRFRRKSMQFDRDSLVKGDIVVHTDHGIGIYEGLQRVPVRSQPRECLRIRYKDNMILFIPLEHFNLVEKYVGSTGTKPTLSRIGGKDWARAKGKTKKAVQEMTTELLKLYAQRKVVQGHAFSPDTHWQHEMEASFEFEDTPDQGEATLEIKTDLEAPYPMDRLLCGDVGFGKTEVAIRAAFKVVQDSFQVAVLVPTTILAQQHYETFRERMSVYPIRIEMLSRFRTTAEQKAIVQKVASGDIDIIIGTHRLLSKDIGFKRLGLLIIDEEHRFGVRHKEKLKQLKTDVDVLTMSATPIPRTLHLAMSGARDTSQINTPPVDRLPIQTEVYPFSEELITEAILREADREGQVFFLHNRVESIHAVKSMLERLLPELRYAVAHGQMPENQLEHVMIDFMNHRYDVLICTTIIESGIDIPNANTLIINRADRFGLAQLYQIRGRIGRSNRQAYAYLLVPPKYTVTTDARRRLSTLTELTELGSGMKIALRDLEIRGAGNLLGPQQSGFINAVGFDLYTRMLEESVQEIKGEMPQTNLENREVKLEFDGPALIPADYVDDGDLRYHFYKRLSIEEDMHSVDRLQEELIDRFGKLPVEARNLIELARLKILSRLARIKKVSIEKQIMSATLDLPTESEKVQSMLRHIVLQADPEPMEFKIDKEVNLIHQLTMADRLHQARKFLHHLTRNGKFVF